jgi:hypothetical protein
MVRRRCNCWRSNGPTSWHFSWNNGRNGSKQTEKLIRDKFPLMHPTRGYRWCGGGRSPVTSELSDTGTRPEPRLPTEDQSSILRLASIYPHGAERTASNTSFDGVFSYLHTSGPRTVHRLALLQDTKWRGTVGGPPKLICFIKHSDGRLRDCSLSTTQHCPSGLAVWKLHFQLVVAIVVVVFVQERKAS